MGDLLDAVKAVCFYLPFWVVPILAATVAFIAYWLGLKIFADLMTHSQGALPNIPLFMGIIAFILIFVAGTLGWAERTKRKAMLAQTNSLEKLRRLSWREFEILVGEAYRKEGYRVLENFGAGADGGIDLDTRSPTGDRVLIQCKHWRAQKIGVAIVREMLGVLTREKADRVDIIGTGYFTVEAQNWAQGQPIELIDGPALLTRIHNEPFLQEATRDLDSDSSILDKVELKEVCPMCGSELVIRTAKRGPNAGNQFMGCSAYPKCRFTNSL